MFAIFHLIPYFYTGCGTAGCQFYRHLHVEKYSDKDLVGPYYNRWAFNGSIDGGECKIMTIPELTQFARQERKKQ